MKPKHIIIDGRSRQASTGKPIERLLEYLQELDHTTRYTVLVRMDDPWQPTQTNFTVLRIPYKNFSLNPFQQLTFSRFLYKLRPDLVHFTLTGTAPFFYFGRQITMTHDLTMLRFARAGRFPAWVHKLRMIGYHVLFFSAHLKARKIITPTNYVASDLAKHYSFTKAKTEVIYEASEPPIKAKSDPLKGVGKQFIFHVGSPFPHKNIERLIEAFESLVTHYPDLQLVLPGKKEFYFEKLQKQIDASPAKAKILVPGFVSAGELKWLYQNAAAYVLPSLSEGFGLPGLEAMVHGCPLASSNATCLPEVYGEAAHYFDPGSVIDIAQKVSDLLESKELRQDLVEKGYAQAAKYSWRRMAEETLAIYEQVLGHSTKSIQN